jgi:hypothetical protein
MIQTMSIEVIHQSAHTPPWIILVDVGITEEVDPELLDPFEAINAQVRT